MTHFAVAQEISDNLRGEDEVLSVTVEADTVYLLGGRPSHQGIGRQLRTARHRGAFSTMRARNRTVDDSRFQLRGTGAGRGKQLLQDPGGSRNGVPDQADAAGNPRHLAVPTSTSTMTATHGRKLASAGYSQRQRIHFGPDRELLRVSGSTSKCISYDEDFGSSFTVEVQVAAPGGRSVIGSPITRHFEAESRELLAHKYVYGILYPFARFYGFKRMTASETNLHARIASAMPHTSKTRCRAVDAPRRDNQAACSDGSMMYIATCTRPIERHDLGSEVVFNVRIPAFANLAGEGLLRRRGLSPQLLCRTVS